MKAWEGLKHIPLKIRGSGKLLPDVQSAAQRNSKIEVIDRLPKTDIIRLLKGARFLVWPSQGYYETFGFVAAEAFACGVPVIASNVGVMQEMVRDQATGLSFEPNSADDLAIKVVWAWEHRNEMAAMSNNARQEFEEKYSAEINYAKITSVYQSAIRQYKQ